MFNNFDKNNIAGKMYKYIQDFKKIILWDMIQIISHIRMIKIPFG